MENADYLDALRTDAPALVRALGDADPTAAIRACPDWTAIDLAWHLAQVHQRFVSIVQAGPDADPPPRTSAERPAEDAVVLDDAAAAAGAIVAALAAAAAAAGAIVAALAAVDPAAQVRTWYGRSGVEFVFRRMAHETAVHRVDAERVAGRDHTIPAELAADGIDEYLTLFRPRRLDGGTPPGGRVHLHCTDTTGEWLLTPADDGREVLTVGHARGDAAIRGAANDLLLALWERDGAERLDIVGDADVAARFLRPLAP